ncbi:hypothetical protein [Bradyrhizobium elkanii]|uniref:hypothetical protein n=1 Tax=Bradyrhizobium elkanii TaxID=29448 RepID=UPI00114CDFBA|nr:hypothetical protein [Bradyrhizobium elkanii]
MTPKQQHSTLKGAINRGIVVLDALGDSELKFQSVAGLELDGGRCCLGLGLQRDPRPDRAEGW